MHTMALRQRDVAIILGLIGRRTIVGRIGLCWISACLSSVCDFMYIFFILPHNQKYEVEQRNYE